MAKIIEDVILIKFSRIVKDHEALEHSIIGDEVLQALEQVAQELVGSGVVVEAEKP